LATDAANPSNRTRHAGLVPGCPDTGGMVRYVKNLKGIMKKGLLKYTAILLVPRPGLDK
jgi:hypothetical protein